MSAEPRTSSDRTQSPWTGALRWFDPRAREVGMWAFALNRLTALGLTLYLVLHLAVLSQLAGGEAAYDGLLVILKNPLIMFGELLVVAGGFIHGLNGLRVALTSFGIGVPYHRNLFLVLMVIAALAIVFFAFKIFSA